MVMRLARTVAEPTAKNGFLFTILGSKWGFLWLWLLIINVLALLAYGLDKLLAKLKEHAPKTRRIPEKTLLLLAAHGWAWSCSATRPSTALSVSASPCSP